MEILQNPLFPRKLKRYAEFGLAAYGIYTEGKKLYQFGAKLYEKYEDRGSYTIEIKDSELFKIFQDSVVSKIPSKDNKVLEIAADASYRNDVEAHPSFTDLKHFYIGEHKIRIIVEVQKEDVQQDSRGIIRFNAQTERIKLKAANYAGFLALQKELQRIVDQRVPEEDEEGNARYATFHSLKSAIGTANNPFRSKTFRCRPIESVFLTSDVKEDLLNDIETFKKSRTKYQDFGIPYRRGYLFHGPPGTGKSSIVSMISGITVRDVYNITLNDIKSDRVLGEIMGEIHEGSIVLFEDVDSFKAAKSREDGHEDDEIGVTLSGLLNALDGLESLQDVIIIMTTNHLDKLDPALIRPGRIDKIIEIGFVTSDQLSTMVEAFTGEKHDYFIPEDRFITPATVIEYFKRNFYSVDKVHQEILELIAQ